MNQLDKDNLIIAAKHYPFIAIHGNLLVEISFDSNMINYFTSDIDDFNLTPSIYFYNTKIFFDNDLDIDSIKISHNAKDWTIPIKLSQIPSFINLEIFV